MTWVPPRDAADPDRFYSGDAVLDRLCTCSITERNRLLLSIDIKQLRPYVVLACLQVTNGEPRGFMARARERMIELWGTGGKADELIQGALHTFRDPDAARRSRMARRGL